ncbi:hypothetical protein EJ07DRAFT_171124 [Lizonia empirigonia]|nr:hypothetical protein EJ07DRAFT_171124 [Lizonia empirigonia]
MSPTTTSPAPLDETALKGTNTTLEVTDAAPKATDAALKVTDAVLQATDAGVKKPVQKKKVKNNGFKNNNARQALRKMHVFFKAHRDLDEYKDMSYGEQQKVLGKLWKASPENPKNSA